MKNIKCSHCKGMFDKLEVVKYSKNSKGVQYYMCNECNTERAKKYRNTKIGRSNINKAVRKSIMKNRDKQNARQNLNYHLKVGHIIKPYECEKCTIKNKLEAHHEDYNKPLNVIWLCKKCHSLIERER